MSAPFRPITIRCSSLSGYSDCPRRGAARLFRDIIKSAGYVLHYTPRGIGAVIGTAVHRAAEVCFAEKARSGSLPPESVATDAAVGELGITGDVEFDGPRGATHTAREAEQQTVSMTRVYWRTIAPTVEPIMVETRLEAELPSGLILSGQPDLVAREPNSVRDLKTGARFGSHLPQIGGYSLLARSNDIDIEGARIDWLQRVVVSKPQPDPVSAPFDVRVAETAASSVIKHMEGDLHTFMHGDPERRIMPGDPAAFLANPSSVLCSARWCPCFDTEFCREGKAAKGDGVL